MTIWVSYSASSENKDKLLPFWRGAGWRETPILSQKWREDSIFLGDCHTKRWLPGFPGGCSWVVTLARDLFNFEKDAVTFHRESKGISDDKLSEVISGKGCAEGVSPYFQQGGLFCLYLPDTLGNDWTSLHLGFLIWKRRVITPGTVFLSTKCVVHKGSLQNLSF